MSTSTGPRRVLVVDDDPGALGLVKVILSRAGHPVETAENGEEALAKLERGKYSAVVSDLEMPKKRGIDVLRELRSRGDLTPLLLMSGSLTDDVIEECKPHASVGWIRKPFTVEGLEQALSQILAGPPASG